MKIRIGVSTAVFPAVAQAVQDAAAALGKTLQVELGEDDPVVRGTVELSGQFDPPTDLSALLERVGPAIADTLKDGREVYCVISGQNCSWRRNATNIAQAA